MKHNSRRAWKLVKNLSNDPSKPTSIQCNVTANQIAHQLLLNGKTTTKKKRMKITRNIATETSLMSNPFDLSELNLAIKEMKTNKAPGIDNIRTEQIKQFGALTLQWILDMMNNCISEMTIPKMWRKAHVVALLKPGKDPNDVKNFRPVSLLCHLFKVLERMVLNRIIEPLENLLSPNQAGFRPGKSCCGQVLNLTQFIEDGFEKNHVTGVALIDLTAAYDTINHNRLIYKVYETTKDYTFTKFIECILQNRRFFVSFQNKNSRWRRQNNGLAQGSVLAPMLYNIYSNDQPDVVNTRQFRYADDTAVAAQADTFEKVEEALTSSLSTLSTYFIDNHLRPNPLKTQVCAFHLKNREAKRNLNITWQGQQLENCPTPKYLGVKLDRTLSFQQHCLDTKKKVAARNNIIRKLTGTAWGAQPDVLRTSALALCFSTAEYASPVWRNSAHSRQVDISVNNTVRITTGCLKPTPLDKIYPVAGIAPPEVRRQVAAEIEKGKQQNDSRHPLFNYQPQLRRLKSRKAFMGSTKEIQITPEERRIHLWRQKVPYPIIDLKEEISSGSFLPYPTWRALNRLRTEVGRCAVNMKKWGIKDHDKCECGAIQDMKHLLRCPNLNISCTEEDLLSANENAIQVANHWKYII